MREQENSVLGLVPMKPHSESHNETMLGTIFCVTIYILFILSTFLSGLLVLFLVSFFSISILARLREGGVFAMWLHIYGLLANARLQDIAYVRWAWSEEKLFEMSSIVLCFFVILSAVLLMISRAFGKDGQLIGIAGIEVFREELDGNLRDLVQRALDNQSAMGYLPGTFADTNLTCIYQTAVRSEESCSASATNGGICEASDATTGLQLRVCCDGCLGPPPPASSPTEPSGTNLSEVVLLAVIVPLAGGLLTTRFLSFWTRCKKLFQRKPESILTYLGGSFRAGSSRVGSFRREAASVDKVRNPE